jgi:hypothetical protein
MNYTEFRKFLLNDCKHETVYEDSEGREILVINTLDAFVMATKMVKKEREACAKVCETQWSNVAEKMYGLECAAAIRARGQT